MHHLWHALYLLIVSSATAKVWPLSPDTNNADQATLMITSSGDSTWEHVNKTCLARDCSIGPATADVNLQHLWHIERYMRHDADPCLDFYTYACGNWRNMHKAGESAMILGGRRQNERYVSLFERLLRNPRDLLHREPVFDKLLSYYTTCRDSGDSLNLRGYLERLTAHGHLRRLPSPHWLELVARLGRYGYSGHFIQLEVKQQNATKHHILIEPHNTALKVNLSAEVHAALRSYTNLTLSELSVQFERLESDLTWIVNNATMPNVDYDTYICYCFAELVSIVGEVDWQRILSVQFNGSNFDQHHKLLVDNVDALRQIVYYLNNADPGLLTVYTLARFLNYLQVQPHNPVIRDVNDIDFNSNTADAAVAVNYKCVRHMRKTLYLAMNYAYELAYFTSSRTDSELVISEVFSELKEEFGRSLTTNSMALPLDIVSEMLQKLRAMRLNIGNIPVNATQTFYDNCITHWLVGKNFYENHLQSLLHYYAHLAALERAPTLDNGIWYTFNHHTPNILDNIDATPYFYCLSNIIIIPYAYLQLPFYDAHFWPALLYGDLANTLGHEMLHAFDSYFVDYDPMGNLRDYSIQLEQNTNYLNNLQCLNDSTSVYLNERIADISGTRLALHTYLRAPSIRRANGRLYFLQFAQFFCGDDSDVYHDEGSKRLNYTLAHMPEFAEVFGCPADSPMNPTKRCKLW